MTPAAPGPPPRVRPARESDLPALQRIVEVAYRGHGGWTTEAHLVRGTRTDEHEVRALLSDPDVLLLVAELTREPGLTPELVGCCYTRRDAERSGDAELGLFAVHPSAQGRGIGRRLVQAQVERRAVEGVRRLRLQVLQGRPELHAWYERLGFRATGAIHAFPADPQVLIVPGLGMEEMVLTMDGCIAAEAAHRESPLPGVRSSGIP